MFEVDIVYLRNLETGSAPAALRTGNTRHCWACMSLKILIKRQLISHLVRLLGLEDLIRECDPFHVAFWERLRSLPYKMTSVL